MIDQAEFFGWTFAGDERLDDEEEEM